MTKTLCGLAAIFLILIFKDAKIIQEDIAKADVDIERTTHCTKLQSTFNKTHLNYEMTAEWKSGLNSFWSKPRLVLVEVEKTLIFDEPTRLGSTDFVVKSSQPLDLPFTSRRASFTYQRQVREDWVKWFLPVNQYSSRVHYDVFCEELEVTRTDAISENEQRERHERLDKTAAVIMCVVFALFLAALFVPLYL